MSDIVKDVGFRIRELREERGLSQEERAERAVLHRACIGQDERAEKGRVRSCSARCSGWYQTDMERPIPDAKKM
jgi:ribosome-binding protein aMBF1 (putative translation factor)